MEKDHKFADPFDDFKPKSKKPRQPKKPPQPNPVSIDYQEAKKLGFKIPEGLRWNSKETTKQAKKLLKRKQEINKELKSKAKAFKHSNDIIRFLTTSVESEATFKISDSISLKKLFEILKSINITHKNKYLIGYINAEGNEMIYAPTLKFIQKLEESLKKEKFSDLVDGFSQKAEMSSDEEFLLEFSKNRLRNFVIKAYPNNDENIPQGAFFNMFFLTPSSSTPIETEIITCLERAQIFTMQDGKISNQNYKDNCLAYAIFQAEESGLIDKGTYDKYINYTLNNKTRYIQTNTLSKISKFISLNFEVRDLRPDGVNIDNKYYPSKSKRNKDFKILELGLINDHFFLNEKINFSIAAVKNYKYRNWKNWQHYTMLNKSSKSGKLYLSKVGKVSFADTFDLVRYFIKQDLFYKYTFSELESIEELGRQFNENRDDYFEDASLDFSKFDYDPGMQTFETCNGQHPFKTFNGKEESYITYFLDIETTTNTARHVPYQCVAESLNDDKPIIKYTDPDCVKKVFDDLPKKNILIFIHNLGYDVNFIARVPGVKIKDMIKISSSSYKMVKGYYKPTGMNFVLKCSYSLTSIALAKFGPTFKLEFNKEIMPYRCYTENSVKKTSITIDKAIKALIADGKSEKDIDIFLQNVRDLKMFTDKTEKHFKHLDYSMWYCERDVNVMKKGMTIYREELKDLFNIEVFNFVSIPSMAFCIGRNKGVFRGLDHMSGIVREFIQKTVHGGRVMCANNEKNHLNDEDLENEDFDGVSLYPSGMVRDDMIIPGGKLFIIDETLDVADLDKFVAYYVQVKIYEIPKSRRFPILCETTKEGIKNYTNTCTDSVHYLTKVHLEDALKYHEIKKGQYKIIKGYGFTKIANNMLAPFMNFLFEQRLKYKNKSSPDYNHAKQFIMKLLMNSFYGKFIQKPIDDSTKIIYSKAGFNTFIKRHYNNLIEVNEVNHENGSFSMGIIKKHKNTGSFNSYPHVGANILAISKRIMNEVMDLAEDENLPIYYQDTDSMHIDKSSIPKLSSAFYQKYNRELIGTKLGQFHSDFDFPDVAKAYHAVESIFLGKKCYIDNVLCSDSEGNDTYRYHIRMKGIPNSAILAKCKEKDITPMELYRNLLTRTCDEVCPKSKKNGYDFNMLAGGVSFETSKTFQVSSRTSMHRFVSF
jgi:hypothetical protein